jgi:hypothetical protein
MIEFQEDSMTQLLAALLFIGSILVGLGGILFLSEATMGVGILAFAALLGIWSRIIQAAGNHRALLNEIKSGNGSTS